MLSYLVAPIFWFVLPLLLAIVQLPLAMARAVFSSRRDVVASCSWPGELELRFRTDAATPGRRRHTCSRPSRAGTTTSCRNASVLALELPG